jgi:hypothetical protein
VISTIEVWDRLNTTLITTLTTLDAGERLRSPISISAQDRLNEDGALTFSIATDHPEIDELQPFRVVRVLNEDGDYVAAGYITASSKVTIDTPERKIAEFTCPGLLGQWATSVVDPWIQGRPISTDRVWNWASPTLDLSDWDATIYNVDRPGGPRAYLPEAWPVPPIFNAWIWTRPSGTQPLGDCLFRHEFTLPSATDVVFFVAADNTADIWIDGVVIAQEFVTRPDQSGSKRTWRWVVSLSAGVHHLAILVNNWAGGADNPAGLLAAVFEVEPNGSLGEPLFTSASSGDWVGVDYPEPKPGYTAAEILEELLSEAQARGELIGWTIDADGSFEEIEEFAVRIGDSYRSVIDALTTGYLDVWADLEGLVLHIVPKDDGRGTTTAVEFVEAENLQYLSVNEDANLVNAVQVIWSEGAFWRTNSSSISTYGRRAQALTLANITNVRSARAIADQYLAAYSMPLTTYVAQVVPVAGSRGGVDYLTGDTVTLAGEVVRCLGLTFELLPDGGLLAVPEFESQLTARQRERQRAIDRLVAKFDQAATAAILAPEPKISSGVATTEVITWSWSGALDNIEDQESPWQPYRVSRVMRIFGISVEVNEAPGTGGASTFELLKNGTTINPLYNLALENDDKEASKDIWGYETVSPADRINIRSPFAGKHTNGTVTLRFADPV